MARITLHIDADDAEDLFNALNGIVQTRIDALYEEDEPQPEAGATQDAEPGERQARFKRTKDEIARGLTPEQAKAERAGRPSADYTLNQETNGSSSDSPVSTSQPTSVDDSDPFADSQPTSDASPATTALTPDDVRGAMTRYLAVDGHEAAGMLPIFARFKTTEGDPCARASQLQAKDYEAFVEALGV